MTGLTLPFRRIGAVLTMSALALGLTAATTLTAPAAQASTCDIAYEGTWQANDPEGQLVTVDIAFPNCSLANAKVHVVSHSFLGLGGPDARSDWGTSTNVTWGYLGTSMTVKYYFSGLTETLYIEPPINYVGLPVYQSEDYADGSRDELPLQTFYRG